MTIRAALVPLLVACAIPAGASPADGPPVTRLTDIVNSYPHPSPDGTRVVYQSDCTGTPQIWVMDADGTNRRRLTDLPRGAETPKWSPDGTLILFAAYLGEDDNDVFVMAPDGSDVRQLTDGPGYDGHPSWSADGERIIFNSDRTTPDPAAPWNRRWHEIFSMRPDGGDLRQHTHLRAICTYPTFSPDGTRIAYRKVTDAPAMTWDLTLGTRNSEIFVADADGGNETNLTASAAFDGWPAWCPDGSLIAFASNRAGPANVGQIYVVAPDGTGLRQVTFGPWGHAQPAWSADGRRLYAYQFQETATSEFGNVVVVDLDR